MEKEISEEWYVSLLKKMFPMGYGSGLRRETTEIDRWHIGYLSDNITIPIEVFSDGEYVYVAPLKPTDSEIEKEHLFGYITGRIEQMEGHIRFADEVDDGDTIKFEYMEEEL